MKTRGLRRLLVAGDTGQLFGIVSLDDLLDAVAQLPAGQPRAVRIPVYSYV